MVSFVFSPAACGFHSICRKSLLVVVLLLFPGLAIAKDATKDLPPRFREWLTKDVAYIITNQERDAFLQLSSEQERDQFIERFWELRNPTPGSPDNPYKMEHYRRIAYANTYFGHVSHTEGWRTPMGRIYITLGEPSQSQKLFGLQKITPMEIWFYSNANPALPPFFYVVFYQRDPMDEFRLYSPYSDGPEKLITAVVGPTRANALNILSQDAGRDVARVTLSLLPDEPVDIQSGTVSLQSDVMLATIRNLANNPLSQSELAHRRQLLEEVSHRVVLGEEYLDVVTVPLRDAAGNTNLHYVLRLKKPEDFTLGQSAKGGYYYSILASVKVYGADGKLIFNEEKKIARDVNAAQFEQVKGKLFGYEGWLPLPPNKYKLEFQLANILGNTAFRRAVEVVIPDPQAGGLQASNLVPFAEASMISPEAGTLPFSGAGVKFIPMAGRELQLVQGQELRFFYQVWLPLAESGSRTGKKLQVDYVYGRLGAQDNKTIHDEIPMEQVDAGGSIINGKQIATGELSVGNYRLVTTLRDPETGAKAYGSLNFGVYTTTATAPAWDVSDEKIADNIKSGAGDYQRALCYLARGDKIHATEWFQKAYFKNSKDELYRNKLIELYFDEKNYGKVLELYANSGLDDSTDEQTIFRIAESFDKAGDLRKAVGVMESGTSLKPGSGPLLLGLAEYYRKAGDVQKAAAAEKKGKQLMFSQPES
jgi:GWxTD domain-containing protein